MPFAKRPPSQHQMPIFYWRGGNELKEKEYLEAEYSKLFLDRAKAEDDLKSAEEELARARSTLMEREGYSNALASFMDSDTQGATEEIQLKKELEELQNKTEEADLELQKYTSQAQPAVTASLQKEKAYYLLEKQRYQKSYLNALSTGDQCRNQAALIVTSNRYRRAVDLEFQYDKALKKRNYLRQRVIQAKNEIDSMTPSRNPLNTKEAKDQRKTLTNGIETKLAIQISEEKLQRHPIKYKAHLDFLLHRIEELNYRMKDIGYTDGIVDVDQLREEIFSPDSQKKNEEEDEEEQNREINEEHTEENIDQSNEDSQEENENKQEDLSPKENEEGGDEHNDKESVEESTNPLQSHNPDSKPEK